MPKDTFLNLDEEKRKRVLDASIEEFSNYPYNDVKLSRIIKASKIPRGSFYQYFEDKKDLYMFIFDIIAKEKIKFMGGILPNPQDTPFIELFYQIYCKGLEFAVANPKYVMISKHLMTGRGDLFKEIVGDNFKLAHDYYVGYINTDKKLGRIRDDIDSDVLADMFIDATNTIAFNGLIDNGKINEEKLTKKITNIINILKKGIQ